jgi:hypothetical protein
MDACEAVEKCSHVYGEWMSSAVVVADLEITVLLFTLWFLCSQVLNKTMLEGSVTISI